MTLAVQRYFRRLIKRIREMDPYAKHEVQTQLFLLMKMSNSIGSLRHRSVEIHIESEMLTFYSSNSEEPKNLKCKVSLVMHKIRFSNYFAIKIVEIY